ncbi:GATA-type domain-containing protein [Balamuthia mandrillaris]
MHEQNVAEEMVAVPPPVATSSAAAVAAESGPGGGKETALACLVSLSTTAQQSSGSAVRLTCRPTDKLTPQAESLLCALKRVQMERPARPASSLNIKSVARTWSSDAKPGHRNTSIPSSPTGSEEESASASPRYHMKTTNARTFHDKPFFLSQSSSSSSASAPSTPGRSSSASPPLRTSPSPTRSASLGSSPFSKSCTECGTFHTPEWRRGPLGPRSLCNACGLRYFRLCKKKRLQASSEERRIRWECSIRKILNNEGEEEEGIPRSARNSI